MRDFGINPEPGGHNGFRRPRSLYKRTTVAVVPTGRTLAETFAQVDGFNLTEELPDPGAERFKQSLQGSSIEHDLEIICESFNLNEPSQCIDGSVDLDLAMVELLKKEFNLIEFVRKIKTNDFSAEAFLRSLVEYAFAHKPNTEDGLNNFSTNFISLYKHLVQDS